MSRAAFDSTFINPLTHTLSLSHTTHTHLSPRKSEDIVGGIRSVSAGF